MFLINFSAEFSSFFLDIRLTYIIIVILGTFKMVYNTYIFYQSIIVSIYIWIEAKSIVIPTYNI